MFGLWAGPGFGKPCAWSTRRLQWKVASRTARLKSESVGLGFLTPTKYAVWNLRSRFSFILLNKMNSRCVPSFIISAMGILSVTVASLLLTALIIFPKIFPQTKQPMSVTRLEEEPPSMKIILVPLPKESPGSSHEEDIDRHLRFHSFEDTAPRIDEYKKNILQVSIIFVITFHLLEKLLYLIFKNITSILALVLKENHRQIKLTKK
jgi:hypothetical protein